LLQPYVQQRISLHILTNAYDMSAPSKIRVALIGLNAPPPGTPTGTSWAASGHLPYLLGSDKYELVALQNSSTDRAFEAIKAYGLDSKTKAYETPEGMVAPEDVSTVADIQQRLLMTQTSISSSAAFASTAMPHRSCLPSKLARTSSQNGQWRPIWPKPRRWLMR
jgi:hypothetical protein